MSGHWPFGDFCVLSVPIVVFVFAQMSAVAGKSGKAVTAMQLAKSLNGCAAASKVKIVKKFNGSKQKLKKKHKWPKVDPEVVTAMLARSRMTMNQGTSVGLPSLGRLSFPTSAS